MLIPALLNHPYSDVIQIGIMMEVRDGCWVRDFLLYVREPGGYSFDQTLDLFLAEAGGRVGTKPWQPASEPIRTYRSKKGNGYETTVNTFGFLAVNSSGICSVVSLSSWLISPWGTPCARLRYRDIQNTNRVLDGWFTQQRTLNCAIYTRKSTEEGRDQEFNTLDAQRESAEAYIKSQESEGWVCLPEEYPQRNKRRINSVEPGKVQCFQCFQCLLYRWLRQYIREWQFAVLQELSL
jgi:hypothetical protein